MSVNNIVVNNNFVVYETVFCRPSTCSHPFLVNSNVKERFVLVTRNIHFHLQTSTSPHVLTSILATICRLSISHRNDTFTYLCIYYYVLANLNNSLCVPIRIFALITLLVLTIFKSKIQTNDLKKKSIFEIGLWIVNLYSYINL